MNHGIELEDLSAKRTAAQNEGPGPHNGGRLNLDANQEQAVALWAYVATAS